MHFSEKVYNIQSAIQQLELPLVVKSENEYPKGASSNTSYEDTLRLPPSSINLLERKTAIAFAQVTVLDFHEPDQMERENGINFIESHSEYEDENYLLPITYSGKCKIIHPPGKTKRYIDVSKLIEDLPRYVRVNDQLKLLDHDTMVTRVVSPGNKLEVVDIKAVANNRARSLICRNSENQKLLLKEGMLVNLTAVDDDATYTLTQLKDMKILLPKCIELQEVTPSDIVMSEDQDAHRIRVITLGPLKLLSFVKHEFVLSWCPSSDSDSNRSTFNLALIPKRKWKNEKVKVRNFDSQDDKQQYTKKHFPGSKDSIFIKYKLYLVEDQDEPGIVYLQDRVSATQTNRKKSDHTRPAAILLEREPFPDSDTEDYEQVLVPVEPAPALPPKGRNKSTRLAGESIKDDEKPPKQWQELKTWIGSVKHKLGLDKVHSEISQRGSDIMQKLRKWKTPDRPPSSKPKLAIKPKPELKHSVSLEAPISANTNLKRSQSVVADVKTRSLPSNYCMEFENKTDSVKETYRKDKKFATTRPSIINRPRLPIPEVCRAEDSEKAGPQNTYEDIDETELQDSGTDIKEFKRVSCEGQTAEDFYGYSVDQVAECFKLIALPDIAKLCEKEKINGAFFKDLSEDQIGTYFQLEPFHFIKVKKAIFDGWRPK